MANFLERFRNPLFLLLVVLVQTVWLATQVHPVRFGSTLRPGEDGHNVTLLRRWAMDVAGPVERGAHGSGDATHRLWANYLDLRGARQQNAALKAEVARLRLEQAAFAQDAAAGRRLQRLLDLRQHYVTSTVAAQVIGTSGSDRSHVLWIDKGSADGLAADQPVITPEGVVGKLRDVMPHTAQLVLLSDPSSGAGVVLTTTHLRAIVRGTAAGAIEIGNLTPDERIKAGEQVLTSGGDQVFPRGLPVGTVASVRPDVQHPPYTIITLHPAAPLRQLEDVLVITGTAPTLSPAAQGDAMQAEATAAAANQRAADLIAARLPSIHEAGAAPETTGAAANAPANATDPAQQQKVAPPPQVKPPAHKDRYSPGITPDATDLTPGAPH